MVFKNTTIIVCLLLFAGCSSSKKNEVEVEYKPTQPLVKLAPYDEGYPLTDKDVNVEDAYKTDDYISYYSDYYKDKTTPPPFNFDQDIQGKSFNELRMLRYEIIARHGFLFMDYVTRSYFNATKWYKPVFWYNDFQIKLSDQEKEFMAKVLKAEQELYAKNYITANGYKNANSQNVVNWQQFNEIPTEMMNHLLRDGFVINKASYEQLFHVYDENYYDYTPSFITTDLFLQVLHMHISKEMQAIEEDKMIPLVTEMVSEQYAIAKKMQESSKNSVVKKAAAWNQVYYAVALSLMKDQKINVSGEFQQSYTEDLEKAQSGQGFRSTFLGDSLIDFTQFQPRGNYTLTDSLKRYFKCIKWLTSAYIFVDDDARLASAVLMGKSLLQSGASLKQYSQFSNIVGFLAGDENNLSLGHLMKVLKGFGNINTDALVTKENLQKIRSSLYALDPRIMKPKGINDSTEHFLARKKLLFTAGRYTFDGEILQRLVHVTEPTPMRKFPKGLDVFAAMGNKTAESILINDYREQDGWPGYPDTLNRLKQHFASFHKWDISIYSKTMEVILSLQNVSKQAPYYMQMPSWQKKNLNTMLSSWAELKHDMVLYIEQPSAAEMGDGGEIPPPQKIAYVEPHLEFWNKCLDLLKLNEKVLIENDLLTGKLVNRNNRLKTVVEKLIAISQKELMGEMITNEEFESLAYIGGEIEGITLSIIESTEMVISEVKTPERYIAVASDVYTYRQECLQECVGMGDEIYVIVEINGLLYLSRGAVFSHYEFTQPSSDRLTDEAWQKQLLDGNVPEQAPWLKSIQVKVPKVKTSPNFNLY